MCELCVCNVCVVFVSLVPAKLMREWRAQFEAGLPLYEAVVVEPDAGPTAEHVLEEERINLLDEGDFTEYKVTNTNTCQSLV